MKNFIKTTLLLLALLLPGAAAAYDFVVDGIYYEIDGNEAIVTKNGSQSYSGDVTIPAAVTYNDSTYAVTAIDDYAFEKCSGLTSVTIPNSVISIGSRAFYDCSGLTSMTIPNSVITIGSGAFSDCTELTSVTISNSLLKISNRMFSSCRSLTSVTIPNSVISIGDDAFGWCSGLTSVEIPNSVTAIGKSSFYDCEKLTSINIPNSVTTIGESAFDNSGLTSVTIPNSVYSIGRRAFYSCYSLTSVTIPNSVTSIGTEAFSYCCYLSSVTVETGNPMYDSRDECNAIIETASNTLIVGCQTTVFPNSVTSIGNCAFRGCYFLESLVIPNSITSIGSEAFTGCIGMSSVTIPNSITVIGDHAFSYCGFLKDVYCNITNPSTLVCGDGLFYIERSDYDYSGRTLHVPQGTADAYQADENWAPFFGQIVDDLSPGDEYGDGGLTFTGVGQYPVIEVAPENSTGLDKIFVVYNTDEVKMNYTASTDDAVTWESFNWSSGQFHIEELTDITHAGNVTTLNHVIPNAGYRISDGSHVYYCWVVNYADYCLKLNDMSFDNVAPCDLLKLNVDGQGGAIPYYTVAGQQQVLDRDIKLAYHSLVWDDTNHWWQKQETVESFASLDQTMAIVPPLCDTSFRLTGDRFLEEWGISESVESTCFFTQAVDCRSMVEPSDDVLIDTHGEIIGAVPLQLTFEGYPTDAVASRAWEIATDPEFENVILQQSNESNVDELDYTFTRAGNYYVRYRVANATGTCEAYGETYTIIVNYGEHPYVPGDVNGDLKADIADINALIDYILQGNYYSVRFDVNDDGEINIADVNALIDIIVNGHGVPEPEHEFVDLGLPSGTLWATCNIGATAPEQYGDYFAWGETEPKDVYNWSTYKWCNGANDALTKYCSTDGYGVLDYKNELDLEDDAAHVNWGPLWCMPTHEQQVELMNVCTWTKTTHNGVSGYQVTGPNGNMLFFPLAGERSGSQLMYAGSTAGYWPLTLFVADKGQIMYLQWNEVRTAWTYRCNGYTVRAVRSQQLIVEQQNFDFGEVPIGQTRRAELTIVNNTAEAQTLTVSADEPFLLERGEGSASSITVVVPGNSSGTVRVVYTATEPGEFNGNVTFQSPAFDGGERVIPVQAFAYNDNVPEHRYVDLGLPSGTLWATCNVGASAPEEFGDYFAWGEIEPKENYLWTTYKWCNGSDHTLTKYCANDYFGTVDNLTVLYPEDDAATVNWGSSWCMPTEEQFLELTGQCSKIWTTRNGVHGYLYIGPSGNTLFLPAAGKRMGSALQESGTRGYYWSRSLVENITYSAWCLNFASDYMHSSSNSRNQGITVRAVRVSQD